MDDVWEVLEKFLEVAAPAMRQGLAPGANAAEIAEFEAAVGYTLPDDVSRSLLRHNGQLLVNGNPAGGTLIPCCFRLLSLEGMLDEWQEHRSISEDLGNDRDPEVANPGVKPFFLHAAWIPIAADIGGNSICVDLDPGEGGTVGQVVEFDHEGDSPVRIGSGYRSWLAQIAADLQAGVYRYDNDSHFPGFE